MTPEGKVKDKIKKEMTKMFPTAWSFMPVQMGYGKSGIMDHIYCVPVVITPDMVGMTIGMFLGIEAKTAQGKMTDNQIRERDGVLRAEGIHLTIYGSNDVYDKMKLLENLK